MLQLVPKALLLRLRLLYLPALVTFYELSFKNSELFRLLSDQEVLETLCFAKLLVEEVY